MNRLSFWSGITVIAFMFLGCGKQLPSGIELRGIYASHKQEFGEIVALLKSDNTFDKPVVGEQFTAMTLNPLGPAGPNDLTLRKEKKEEYKRNFIKIGLQYPALVFKRQESVIFVIATKGLSIGGSGTTRGIAYVALPEQNFGFRIVQTEREAESSTYGGIDLVPIEGNWYLYYVNPS